MPMRDVLLFLHIVGVAGWLGGGLYSVYAYSTVARLETAAAGPAVESLQKRDDWFFGLASILVLLSGIGLVLTSEAFGWGDTFVLIGLGAFVLSGIINAIIGKRNNESLAEASSSGSRVIEALRSWQRGSAWDFVILFVVIWAMITKIGA
jgi:uncharacterized membrane protein